MPIDDELEKSTVAAEIRQESERTIQEMLARSAVAGAISRLPLGVGTTVNEMVTQLAFRRVHERMGAMFDQMANHLRDLGEEKIDREWFRSEEFQSLLFEALHQLHVTHDNQKIEMLGKSLANSGAVEFKEEDRKQIFLQLIRDLTPQHVDCLRKLLPAASGPYASLPVSLQWQNRPEVTGRGDDLLVLQMLAADGLVEESLKSIDIRGPSISSIASNRDIDRAIEKFIEQLQKPPLRQFSLSRLGADFLKFVGAEGPENRATATASDPPV